MKMKKLNRPGPTDALRALTFKLDIQTTPVEDTQGDVFFSMKAREAIVSIDADALDTGSRFDANSVAFIGNRITLEDYGYMRKRMAYETRRTYVSRKNKNYFTLAEIVAIVVRFERINRPKSVVINDGRIDTDAVYFEGLCRTGDNGAFRIKWEV